MQLYYPYGTMETMLLIDSIYTAYTELFNTYNLTLNEVHCQKTSMKGKVMCTIVICL
jgi:hypothetical protein